MLYTKVNFIDATGYTYCWDRYYRQKILRGSKPQCDKCLLQRLSTSYKQWWFIALPHEEKWKQVIPVS